MNTPADNLTPVAKELVALVLECDLLQQGYIQDVATLRKQVALQTQNINELAAALVARDEEIAVLIAERNFGKGETS